MNNNPPHLDRGLSLTQATAINMIDMVGIGPFIVLPMVIKMMGGPQFIFAWIAGALLSIIDGMIWSELGAAYPKAGGSYNFLKEAYGKKWGQLLSFLFVWQTVLLAPLVAASGAIGFSQYCSYLYPFTSFQQKIISGGLIILLVILLYRKIETIGKISTVLWITVVITLCWIIYGGLTHHTISNKWLPEAADFSMQLFFVALGQATVKTIYSYLGYYNVCHLGGEIRHPEKNIPRSIFISVAGVALLYLAMNVSVVSVVPWQEAQNSSFIVSTFIEKIYGSAAASFATILVLIVAFSSLFAVLLGYSRIPYAAAADGKFFPVFAKLHPTKHFPYVSLLFLGGLAFIFSLLFRLSTVISAILAMRILIQFVGQAIGVVLLRKRNGSKSLPFKMMLYPLPVIIAIIMWLMIFISTGKELVVNSTIIIAAGIIVYYLLKINLHKKMKKFLFIIFLLAGINLFAGQNDAPIRVLIVNAHPDDESVCAATVYKITHELKGVVDLAVITNGEGGYKYSLLAEPYYNLKLTDEAVGRKYLPTIRKKELMAAGSILGITNYYFFDQQDNHYTLDVDTVLKQVWDVPLIKKRLNDIISSGNYDFIFCLLPTEETHGHHKGATIMALQTVNELSAGKPVVLGVTGSNKNDSVKFVFHGLKNFPITDISDSIPVSTIDRNVSFGYKNQLNYKIIVDWEIAEHKSQGTIQNYVGRGDYENFWYFNINKDSDREKVKRLFEKLQDSHP